MLRLGRQFRELRCANPVRAVLHRGVPVHLCQLDFASQIRPLHLCFEHGAAGLRLQGAAFFDFLSEPFLLREAFYRFVCATAGRWGLSDRFGVYGRFVGAALTSQSAGFPRKQFLLGGLLLVRVEFTTEHRFADRRLRPTRRLLPRAL